MQRIPRHLRAIGFTLLCCLIVSTRAITCVAGENIPSYQAAADEVMRHIQTTFADDKSGLYFTSIERKQIEFTWGNGVLFSALVGASRNEPKQYLPVMNRFFKSLDQYWDTKVDLPGYEPLPTSGGGNDKYYDDNEWMALTFTEAFELTRDRQYLQRAIPVLKFSLSGWDDQLGGGIWWHEGHKGESKNTCSNAPAATACLRLAKFLPPSQAVSDVAMAKKIVAWTSSHLQAGDGLFEDNEVVATHQINRVKLTYNTALMIRANLGLYRWTQEEKYLREAQREAEAEDSLLDKKSGAYRDALKWSHLSVEADLELYRTTHEAYLLSRAKNNADHYYAAWKANPPDELINNAALARMLWLMADTQSDAGRKFWARADKVPR